jgi:DNA-binding response OmpR family regulator
MKGKILVVDDEQGVVEVIKARLEGNDYEVITATNGLEAFIKTSEENPDLIILDVSMPTMNGLQFVKATRGFEMKSIPILILTALSLTKETFKTFGVDHFLTKPFKSDELLEKVAECMKN